MQKLYNKNKKQYDVRIEYYLRINICLPKWFLFKIEPAED